jgi:hypothetical protein
VLLRVVRGEGTMFRDDWKKALADAKNILGSNGVITASKMTDVLITVDGVNKLVDERKALSAGFVNKLLEQQRGYQKLKQCILTALDELSRDNYHLDPKKPDDKKKIDQARALFSKFLKEYDKKTELTNQSLAVTLAAVRR